MGAEFHSIVEGKMRSRGHDNFGSGQPGASRGHRAHKGIDVIAGANEKILSPINGTVIREAFPYPDDPSMRGLLIRGKGEHADWEIKLFYVLGLFSGDTQAGGLIGHAQNLGAKYPGITNHVHMEVFRSRTAVDPREPFRLCF